MNSRELNKSLLDFSFKSCSLIISLYSNFFCYYRTLFLLKFSQKLFNDCNFLLSYNFLRGFYCFLLKLVKPEKVIDMKLIKSLY